jgi:hypothetical protein
MTPSSGCTFPSSFFDPVIKTYLMPRPDRLDFTADDILHDSQTTARIDDGDQDGTLRIPLLDDALTRATWR